MELILKFVRSVDIVLGHIFYIGYFQLSVTGNTYEVGFALFGLYFYEHVQAHAIVQNSGETTIVSGLLFCIWMSF